MVRKQLKKRLTLKQSKLVNGVADGKTIQQSAIDAGYSDDPRSASNIGSRELKKPHVSNALEERLDRAGASLADSANVIGQAHKATGRNQVDHITRLKAAEINLKVRRLIGQSDSPNVQNNFIGEGSFEEFCRAYHRTKQAQP